jgi:predicted methyltransferase
MTSKLASVFAAVLLAAAGVAGTALAQPPQARADAMTDPALKREEVIAFIGVKPGDKVADMVAGRFVRALSAAVGPKGKLYAVMPAEVVKVHPEVVGLLKGLSSGPGGENIEVLTPPVNAMGLPAGSLDAVFIRQNYHDLYDKFMGPADVPAFNKQVFAALKPGGVYVILDHAAPGAPIGVTETLHRIDVAQVKKDVLAAGFKLDGESTIFANAADDHTKNVFDPSVRGKTDQFLLRFRKPK